MFFFTGFRRNYCFVNICARIYSSGQHSKPLQLLSAGRACSTQPQTVAEQISNEPSKVRSDLRRPNRLLTSGWVCPSCTFINFSNRKSCHRCDIKPPKHLMWSCAECGHMNYASRIHCFKCSGNKHRIMRVGDWHCSKCKHLNHSDEMQCFRCKTARTEQRQRYIRERTQLWKCSNCDFMNYSERTECYSCKQPKEMLEETQKPNIDDEDEEEITLEVLEEELRKVTA